MKKLLLIIFLFPCIFVRANELTEDYLDIASGYAISGNYTSSVSYLDKILQTEPSNEKVKELKNIVLRVSNPYQKSYLSQVNPAVRKAFNSKKDGNKKAEELALSSQNDFWPNFLLAKHYSENSDSIDAINAYTKALNIQPDYSYSYLGLGVEYIKNGDWQKAVDALSNYISGNVNSDIAYALRAKAYSELNKFSDAQNDIEKALKTEENFAYLLIEAKILYNKGEYDSAREKLVKLSRNIQTSEVYKYIGLCDYAQKDYTNALLNLDKAIILSDDDKDLIKKYNDIKLMLGDNNEKRNNGG